MCSEHHDAIFFPSATPKFLVQAVSMEPPHWPPRLLMIDPPIEPFSDEASMATKKKKKKEQQNQKQTKKEREAADPHVNRVLGF